MAFRVAVSLSLRVDMPRPPLSPRSYQHVRAVRHRGSHRRSASPVPHPTIMGRAPWVLVRQLTVDGGESCGALGWTSGGALLAASGAMLCAWPALPLSLDAAARARAGAAHALCPSGDHLDVRVVGALEYELPLACVEDESPRVGGPLPEEG